MSLVALLAFEPLSTSSDLSHNDNLPQVTLQAFRKPENVVGLAYLTKQGRQELQ
jgi:hypothetical protein